MVGRREGTEPGWMQTGRAKNCVGGESNKGRISPASTAACSVTMISSLWASASSSVKWDGHEERWQCKVSSGDCLFELNPGS